MVNLKKSISTVQPLFYIVYSSTNQYLLTYVQGELSIYSDYLKTQIIKRIENTEIEVLEFWFQIKNDETTWIKYLRNEVSSFEWKNHNELTTLRDSISYSKINGIKRKEMIKKDTYKIENLMIKMIHQGTIGWMTLENAYETDYFEKTMDAFRNLMETTKKVTQHTWIDTISYIKNKYFKDYFKTKETSSYTRNLTTIDDLDIQQAYLASIIAYKNLDRISSYPPTNQNLNYVFTPLPMSNFTSTEFKIYKGYDLHNYRILQIEGPTDFQAKVFKYNKRMIIAFAGTKGTQIGDLITDLDAVVLGNAKMSSQMKSARILTEYFTKLGYSITLTGHSLGGFIAAALSTEFDCRAIVFNAPGFKKDFYESNKDKGINITQYRIKQDLFVAKYGKYLGKVIDLDADEGILNDLHKELEGNYNDLFDTESTLLGIAELIDHNHLKPSTIKSLIDAHFLDNFFLHIISNSERNVKLK